MCLWKHGTIITPPTSPTMCWCVVNRDVVMCRHRPCVDKLMCRHRPCVDKLMCRHRRYVVCRHRRHRRPRRHRWCVRRCVDVSDGVSMCPTMCRCVVTDGVSCHARHYDERRTRIDTTTTTQNLGPSQSHESCSITIWSSWSLELLGQWSVTGC